MPGIVSSAGGPASSLRTVRCAGEMPVGEDDAEGSENGPLGEEARAADSDGFEDLGPGVAGEEARGEGGWEEAALREYEGAESRARGLSVRLLAARPPMARATSSESSCCFVRCFDSSLRLA